MSNSLKEFHVPYIRDVENYKFPLEILKKFIMLWEIGQILGEINLRDLRCF